MNRQEALIEIMKGNTVLNKNGNEIFAVGLESGHPKLSYKRKFEQRTEDLQGALDKYFAPFTLKPKTKTITLDGKSIEISEESFEAFKKQFKE